MVDGQPSTPSLALSPPVSSLFVDRFHMSGVLNTLRRLRHVLDVHLRTAAAATVTPPKKRTTDSVAIRVGQNDPYGIDS